MSFQQLYEKLGSASPRPLGTNVSEAVVAEPHVSNEVLNQLPVSLKELTIHKQHLVDSLEAVIHKRVEAQRLHPQQESPLYDKYNNPQSQDDIKRLRLEIEVEIKKITQLIMDLYRDTERLPLRGPTSVHDEQTRYLQQFRDIICEYVAMLMQIKQDYKDICREYDDFITAKYYISE